MMNRVSHEAGKYSIESHPWLSMLRRYLGFVVVTNLVWEVLHLPLYTLWNEGSLAEQAFAIVHCTGGDLLISLSALTIALILVGNSCWPRQGFHRVVIATSVIGVSYTVYSERLNTLVRESWAYSEWMPVIPVFEVGLSPIAQWLIIPPLAFWWSRRPLIYPNQSTKGFINEQG
ncbi:MAG: hypothetical protein V7699_06830 [Porticoccus sp.]